MRKLRTQGDGVGLLPNFFGVSPETAPSYFDKRLSRALRAKFTLRIAEAIKCANLFDKKKFKRIKSSFLRVKMRKNGSFGNIFSNFPQLT